MKLSSSYYLALLTLFKPTQSQDTIRNDATIQQDTVNAVDGQQEMIEYLKDVSPQEVSVQCLQNQMCVSIEKKFLAEKEITTFYDKLELRNITDKCGNTFINSNYWVVLDKCRRNHFPPKKRCPGAQKPRCPDAQMPKCPDA